ncbi:MAG: tRNA (adenosine(37)-N6)-threonylcarbamoyltransferase complex dimerization subunit type 1 TsaB [Muribaculaceae bacterium]|nr:tRNA (adenosine(37)-N6)-threonylcarbamoyltransferase complex dimerization subunit type 1 TsaB [Muribaculaceae bacterium]
MARIINIETSSKICSVAVTSDGMIEYHVESDHDMEHARLLGKYVENAMADMARREVSPDAVAVSAGPGSYTGLRIGMSLAKGLCFANDIPLITINTLEILAVKAMFGIRDPRGDELLIPLIDARRMEVYTAAYDFALNAVLPPQSMIIDRCSFAGLLEHHKCIFIGDGVDKAREIIKHPNALFATNAMPLAIDMTALSERAYRTSNFADTAYAVPFYLKEYQATIAQNKVLLDAARSASGQG